MECCSSTVLARFKRRTCHCIVQKCPVPLALRTGLRARRFPTGPPDLDLSRAFATSQGTRPCRSTSCCDAPHRYVTRSCEDGARSTSPRPMVRSGLPWAVDPVLHPYEALGVASELVPRADSELLGAPITDVHGLDRRVGRVPTDPPNCRKGNEPKGVHVYLHPLGQLQDDGSAAWHIATRDDSLERNFDSPPLLCHSWSSQRIARKLPATTIKS